MLMCGDFDIKLENFINEQIFVDVFVDFRSSVSLIRSEGSE